MGCTVFANDDGPFHKGSGGTGQAFPDVCLSPPSPPAGPVPIPYQNLAQASNLMMGSMTVSFDGQPTALEDSSFVMTSTGDEGGTLGGNVVTHMIKGKAYFMLWSFDVKVEGKGVDRHTDPMGQNCASPPPGGLTAAAKVIAKKAERVRKKCKKTYGKKDRHGTPNAAQRRAVNKPNAKCWECKSPSPRGWKKAPPPKPGTPAPRKGRQFVPDHQPPCMVVYYAGGCHDAKKQKKKVSDPKAVKPHCSQCSSRQGGLMSAYKKVLEKAHGR